MVILLVFLLILTALNVVLSGLAFYYAYLGERRWKVAGMMAKIARALSNTGSGDFKVYSAEEIVEGIEH